MAPLISDAISAGLTFATAGVLYATRISTRDEASGHVPTRVEIIYGEVPSEAAAIICGVVYVLVGFALFWRVFKYRHWWGLCLPIGAVASGIGFFVKEVMLNSEAHQNSKALLIAQNVIIVCAPAAFFAFNYILYGRLVSSAIGPQYSLIRPSRVATIFVASDILTFIIQGAGAGMITNPDHFETGKNIFVAGVVLQAASYYLFVVLLVIMHVRVKRAGVTKGTERWWKAIWLLYFSSVFIIVRTVYRIIEGQSTRGSSLRSHEAYFYFLDFLPLILAIIVYVPWWPGEYLHDDSLVSSYPMVDISA
ncbi:hypothetical protein CYLTODRAFT_369641 [Cylindrobasidium torrendii FP15055 ss-10]|uniref:RTA1-domain-containing protein n=1 Tax=Cylindrobasidium torrendii FP15055 ss-10 TaxID=1314674 RepID=A0A0D7BNZ4_9AGAR|nr:hypothetical protein CYLTODRAFT_369641 [Cylindrobasidium torrendii FP15055 ss-10]